MNPIADLLSLALGGLLALGLYSLLEPLPPARGARLSLFLAIGAAIGVLALLAYLLYAMLLPENLE